jgi:hypothetical protein
MPTPVPPTRVSRPSLAVLLLLFLLLGGCAGWRHAALPPAAGRDTLWLLAPEPGRDAVHAADTEATLRARYGARHVARARISLGEGETAPGTVLFGDDPARRLTVRWEDTVRRARPVEARVDGFPTRWAVAPGVSLGTRLSALERLNGRPFRLFGFAWDYGGTVAGWEGGRLDTVWPGRRVRLRLEPDPEGGADRALARQVRGDRLFSSAHPAMRALDPRVYDLAVVPR